MTKIRILVTWEKTDRYWYYAFFKDSSANIKKLLLCKSIKELFLEILLCTTLDSKKNMKD